MKNSNDTIENRSCDLPVSSAVPQPLRHRVPPDADAPFTTRAAPVIAEITEFRMIVNKRGIMWEEVVVTYIQLLSCYILL
jgi:hypothetical protein